MILDIRFDFDRQNRLGLIEAIWGEHKSIEQLKKIAQEVLKKGEFVFITRINESSFFFKKFNQKGFCFIICIYNFSIKCFKYLCYSNE